MLQKYHRLFNNFQNYNMLINYKTMQSQANLIKKILIKIIIALVFLGPLSGCGIYKKTDARKVPMKASERAQKNIQEGKGFRVFDSNRNKNNGVFEFATSNSLWRASINLLDFVPLSNVDYSGGIIITDWFTSENTADESLKITIKFLSNEIRSDSLDIIIHKKLCSNNFNCKITRLNTELANEIKKEIFKSATLLEEKLPNANSEYKIPEILK